MYRGEAAAQIKRDMKSYQLDILGISESRWTRAGWVKIARWQTIIYNGAEQEHEKGVTYRVDTGQQKDHHSKVLFQV